MPDVPDVLQLPTKARMHIDADVNPKPQGVFHNLFQDTLWQVIGSVLSSGMMLAMNMAAVRILGRNGFGAFGLVQTAAMWCSTIFAFGAPTSVMIQAGRLRDKDKRHVIGLCCIYLTVTVLGASILVLVDPPGPGSLIMSELASGIGLLVVIHTAMQVFLTLWGKMLRGADRFQLANMLNVAYSLLLTMGVILGAFWGGDYVGALWGAGISLLLVVVVVTVMGIRSWGIALPPLRLFLSIGGSVGARSYVVTVSEVFAETFGVLYLSYHHDLFGVAAVVGCQRISTLLSKPSGMLQAVLMGKVAGQDSGEVEARKTLQVARFSFIGAFLLSIPLLFLARQFTLLTLGEAFNDAVKVMVLFLLSEVFRGHAIPAAGLLVGQGCQRPYVLLKMGVLVFTVTGVIVLGPQMGAVGVALVQCIMSFVIMVVIAIDLAVQAKSVKSVFISDDIAVLARLIPWRNRS